MFVDRLCIVSDSYFFGTQLVCQLPAFSTMSRLSNIAMALCVIQARIFGCLIRSPDLLPGDLKLYAP